jgi:hypothetical protein
MIAARSPPSNGYRSQRDFSEIIVDFHSSVLSAMDFDFDNV